MTNYYEIPVDAGPAEVAVANQVKAAVIMYPAFKQALKSSIATINLSRSVGLSTGLIIQAEAGMGKTLLSRLLVQELATSHQEIEAPTVTLVTLDSGADRLQIASKMAMSLGYPNLPLTNKLSSITNMVDRAMVRLKPKALVFDEAQHLCEGNREITAKAATDWLKVRMDLHSCPVVLIGEKSIESLYQINTQFVSRASAGYVLEPFAVGDSWFSLLSGFGEQIKGYDLSILLQPKIAKLLQTVTRGTLRELKAVLMYALISTARDDRKNLLVADLAVGCDRAFGSRGDRPNPYWKSVA